MYMEFSWRTANVYRVLKTTDEGDKAGETAKAGS
jgi:hypothetical protein